MFKALRKHKELMKNYPRNGEGLEAFVDSSDTGYTMNQEKPVEKETNGLKNGSTVINDDTANGAPITNGATKKASNAKAHSSGPEGVDGLQNPVANGVNGHANGINGAH